MEDEDNNFMSLNNSDDSSSMRTNLLRSHKRLRSPSFSPSPSPSLSPTFFSPYRYGYKSLNINSSDKKITSSKPSEIQLQHSITQLSNFNKNYSVMKSDFSILESYEKVFFKDTTLDVMFIMDITGSMGMWLTEAKANIDSIITEITENNPCSKIRVSFIGYRDYDDRIKGDFICKDFTENVEEVKKFIKDLDAYGGGDEPEDIAGAFDAALKMKWESNARYCVLVCDAPCHGVKYHNIIYDKYIDGDPSGLVIENLIEEFVKKKITMYCIEINDSTKKMFKVIENIYSNAIDCECHIETLGDSCNKFAFFVAFSASVTLGNITYNKVRLEDVINRFRTETIETIVRKYNKDYYLKEDDALDLLNHINSMNLNENEQKTFDFINRMNSLSIKSSEVNPNDNEEITIIDLVSNFSSAKMFDNKPLPAIVHSLRILNDPTLMNDWITPFTQHDKMDTEFNLVDIDQLKFDSNDKKYKMVLFDFQLGKKIPSYIPKTIPKKHYVSLEKMINYTLIDKAICNFIADSFNIRLFEYCPKIKSYIRFNNTALYEIQNFTTKYLIANFLGVDTINLPLTKNVLEAFTHFSYQITEGYLILSELELNEDKKSIKDFKINRIDSDGYGNIMKFFVSHYCNDVCKKLQLFHPRKKKVEFEVKEEFFYYDKVTNIKVCELCRIPIISRDSCCYECIEKKNKTMKKRVCVECHSQFTFSCYYYNSKLINYPMKCEDCTFRF